MTKKETNSSMDKLLSFFALDCDEPAPPGVTEEEMKISPDNYAFSKISSPSKTASTSFSPI